MKKGMACLVYLCDAGHVHLLTSKDGVGALDAELTSIEARELAKALIEGANDLDLRSTTPTTATVQ